MPVYQYEGKHYELGDGLTDEQAIGKIKSHLGIKEGPSVVDQAIGGLETAATLGTGAVAMAAGLVPAALQSINNKTQGKEDKFEDNYANAIGRMTYEPRTEAGQEQGHAVGQAINRYLVPMAPIAGSLGGGMVGSRAPKAPKARPRGPDVAGAADELVGQIPTDAPQLNSRRPGTQGELFEKDMVAEKLKSDKTNEVMPGAASPYDAGRVGVTSPVNPMRQRAQMEMPFGDTPPVIRQNRQGVGTLGTENPGLVESVRRGAPEDVRVFEEMQQQLQTGAHEAVDTSLPKIDPMESVKQGLEAVRQRGVQEELGKRQDVMEHDVKRQATLDFNAAERARQEKAAIPGLENMQAEQKYAAVQEKVLGDERVLKAEERAKAAEEVYLKAVDAMESGLQTKNPKLLKRLETDMQHFQESVEWVKSNIEFEILNNSRKQDRIGNTGPFGRQRGAWSPFEIKEAMEKLGRGAITGRDYLRSWEGAFNPTSWKRVWDHLNDPNSNTTVAFLSPREFHRLSPPRGMDSAGERPRLHQNIKGALEDKGLLEMPELWIETGPDGVAQIIGHEGRHRMDVFRDEGVNKVPVLIRDQSIKWGQTDTRPRVLRPEFMKGEDGALKSDVLDLPFPKILTDDKVRTPPPPGGPGGKQGGWILLEGKKQKAIQNLATKLDIETKLQEIAPSQWTVEQAIDHIKKASDVDQNFLQRGINYLTKGGMYQALKTHNPMIRYTVERILDKDRMARADIRDVVHDRLGPVMRAMSKKEQGDIWTLVDWADLHQKPIDPILLAKRNFNEKQIKFVDEHRKAMEFGYAMINKARDAAGLPPIDHRIAYAAMRSTGDFRRLVYDKKGGNVVGIVGSDFRHGVNKLASRMEDKGFYVGEERYFGGMPRERGSANQAFMHAIEILAEKDPRVQDFVNVLNDIRTTEVYNFLNAKTHTMQKKGVDGMEGRKSWLSAEENAKEGFKAQLNYLEAAIKWGHLSDAVKDIKKVMDHPEVKMPNAKKWSEDYVYNALGFNPSMVGRNVEQAVASMFNSMGVGYSIGRQSMASARQVTNALLLSLNPRFWATNVVQPLQSMPGMKAMLISRGLDAGFDFGTGYSYLVEGGNTLMKKNNKLPMTPFEKAADMYAYKKHVYGSDMVEHSNRPRKDVGFYAEKVSNAVAGSVESATRQLMFHSFAHMLRENGMKIEAGLFDAAHNLTDIAMNNYSAVERPPMYNTLGPIGDLAVNLQSYKHNELSRIALFARHAKEHKSLRPIATQLITSIAFSGLMGVIAFEEADALFKWVTKLMGKPMSLSNVVMQMSESVNKKVYNATGGKIDQPYALSHGIPSMLGLDMSRSLGLTDVVPDNMGAALFPGGSKLGEMATSTYDFAKNRTEMNAKRMGRAYSPIGLQGNLDNAWFTKETEKGTLSVRPRDLKGQAYRNTTDKWAKAAGFQGINESVQRQKTYNVERISRDYAELREKPLNTMRDEFFASGTVSKEAVQTYLKYRGSIETLEGDLNRYAMEQSMSARDLALFRSSATTSIGAMLKAQDYMEMFKK